MEARNPTDFADQHGFASTHWTTVRACAGKDTVASKAREELCRDYWYPLYAYIRRSGLHNNDAEDLTQDFFAYILNRPWFIQADSSKGKFRSFLLASLKNFLHDRSSRKKALRRGGGYRHVPLDMGGADARYSRVAQRIDSAEAFEVEWASAIVNTALQRLEAEYVTNNRQAFFEHLKIFLTTDGNAVLYESTAQLLQTSVTNVKACVHRLRKRYGALLREEVARTVAVPADVDEEMLHMRAHLAATCAK